VNKHPEAIRRALRGFIRAEKFVKKNPEESRRLVAEFIKTDKYFDGLQPVKPEAVRIIR
jgi:ABC-type nitrate/sulfonate/bicarbonate transport system substrate-binding protein